MKCRSAAIYDKMNAIPTFAIHERVFEYGEKETTSHTWNDGVVVADPFSEEYGKTKYTCTWNCSLPKQF